MMDLFKVEIFDLMRFSCFVKFFLVDKEVFGLLEVFILFNLN